MWMQGRGSQMEWEGVCFVSPCACIGIWPVIADRMIMRHPLLHVHECQHRRLWVFPNLS